MSTNFMKIYNGASWTPRNADPSNPVDGDVQFADGTVRAKGLWEYRDGDWRRIGGGSSSGKNYIQNPDAETDTAGWIGYADAPGSVPVDGTGGSPVTTFVRNTTLPLSGMADFLFTKDAVNRQGEGRSYDFTIDLADRGRMLPVAFDLSTSVNYVDGDMILDIYDVTNARMIEPAGITLYANAQGHHLATFQTSIDSVNYRLILHVASTSALSYTVNFDNFFVGPKEVVKGTFLRNQSLIYPTTGNVLVDRVGEVRFAAGLTSALFVGYGLLTVVDDSANSRTQFLATEPCLGTVTFEALNTVAAQYLIVYKNGLEIQRGQESPAASSGYMQVTSSFYLEAGDYLTVGSSGTVSSAAIPVQLTFDVRSFPRNSQVSSSDAGQRLINFEITKGIQSINNATVTKIINWNAPTYDSSRGWDSTNSRYIIQESGDYQVAAGINFTVNPTGNREIRISVNGVERKIASAQANSTNSHASVAAYPLYDLKKGDYIELYAIQTSGGALDINSLYGWHIHKIQNSQQIFASEVVAASYSSDSGQSFNASTTTVVNYEDKVFDTHNAVTVGPSWKFTVPISGKYFVSGSVAMNFAYTVGNGLFLYVYKNGVEMTRMGNEISSVGAYGQSREVFANVNCVRGDTLDIRFRQETGGSQVISNAATQTQVNVHRIGGIE